MGAGPGGVDSEGVWQFGEADDESLMSDTLNLLSASVSTQFGLDRARLAALEDDSGWITPTLLNSWAVTSAGLTVMYRQVGKTVHLTGRASGGASGSAIFNLPLAFRPQFGGRWAAAPGAGAASALSSVFISDTTGDVLVDYVSGNGTINLSGLSFLVA